MKVILDNLAEGQRPQEIVKSYPSLVIEDVEAVIVSAAAPFADDLYHVCRSIILMNGRDILRSQQYLRDAHVDHELLQ